MSKPKKAAKGPQAYVIQEVHWSYNDQYYYTEEGDPGAAIKVFINKERSEAICRDKNLAEFRRLVTDKGEYSQGLSEYLGEDGFDCIDNVDKFAQMIQAAGGKFDPENYVCELPKDVSDKVLEPLFALVPITFFELKEVDLDTWPDR